MRWWLFPLPNSNSIWPQFRSPLMWDVFAVSTYFTVSVLFWYVGLVPDLAILRDRARTKARQFIYGLFALGWTGSNRHWSNYEKAYLILAGLATPLVLSVHSTVSLDFSVSQLPGWHTTIFPPYFVAGAIYSGFGMVLTLMVPLRKLLKLEEIVTMRHIDLMCKVTLATGSIVGYAYAMEYFIAWYSGNPYERWTFWHRLFGKYWYGGWAMLMFNALVPQVFWFKKVRQNLIAVFIVSILANIGMWFERFVIVVGSLYQDFVPGNWGYYKPTWVDVCTYLGTFGLFFTMFLLFIRFLPLIATSEVKGVTPQADPHHPLGGAKGKEVLHHAGEVKHRYERRLQTLRDDRGVHHRGGHPARGPEGARCRLHALGRVYAVPGARDGQGDGHAEFASGLVLLPGRGHRLHQRHVDGVVHERLRLPDRHRRQTHVQPVLSLRALLRADDSAGGVWRGAGDAVPEPAAAPASSAAEEPALRAGDA